MQYIYLPEPQELHVFGQFSFTTVEQQSESVIFEQNASVSTQGSAIDPYIVTVTKLQYYLQFHS